jgi:hypothetical protein
MPKNGVSRAAENKRIRQEALREQLANKGLVQHVLENTKKMQKLDEEMDSLQLQRLKAANESQLKLINKYLPDLKATEIGFDPEANEIKTTMDDGDLARRIAFLLSTPMKEE